MADHLDLVMQMGVQLTPTRDRKVIEQEVAKAGRDYLELVKRLNSGKSYDKRVKGSDIDAIGKMLAEEYVYTDPKSAVYNKTDELNFYKTSSIILKSAELSNQEVRVDGNTAVETGAIRYRGTNAGNPFDLTKRYTTTWIRRGGRWQIVADHATKVEN